MGCTHDCLAPLSKQDLWTRKFEAYNIFNYSDQFPKLNE
jgi:hypothetical protein